MESEWTAKNAILRDTYLSQRIEAPVDLDDAVGADEELPKSHFPEETEEEFFASCLKEMGYCGPDLNLVQQILDMWNIGTISDSEPKTKNIPIVAVSKTDVPPNSPDDESSQVDIVNVDIQISKKIRNSAVKSLLSVYSDDLCTKETASTSASPPGSTFASPSRSTSESTSTSTSTSASTSTSTSTSSSAISHMEFRNLFTRMSNDIPKDLTSDEIIYYNREKRIFEKIKRELFTTEEDCKRCSFLDSDDSDDEMAFWEKIYKKMKEVEVFRNAQRKLEAAATHESKGKFKPVKGHKHIMIGGCSGCHAVCVKEDIYQKKPELKEHEHIIIDCAVLEAVSDDEVSKKDKSQEGSGKKDIRVTESAKGSDKKETNAEDNSKNDIGEKDKGAEDSGKTYKSEVNIGKKDIREKDKGAEDNVSKGKSEVDTGKKDIREKDKGAEDNSTKVKSDVATGKKDIREKDKGAEDNSSKGKSEADTGKKDICEKDKGVEDNSTKVKSDVATGKKDIREKDKGAEDNGNKGKSEANTGKKEQSEVGAGKKDKDSEDNGTKGTTEVDTGQIDIKGAQDNSEKDHGEKEKSAESNDKKDTSKKVIRCYSNKKKK